MTNRKRQAYDRRRHPSRGEDRDKRHEEGQAPAPSTDSPGTIRGPSPNPATNLIIAGIAMRGAAIVLRRSMEKSLLRDKFDAKTAGRIIKGRTLGATLISAAVSRVALGSVPGFLLVSGGLLAKTAFDRSLSKQKARREGHKDLLEQAQDADE